MEVIILNVKIIIQRENNHFCTSCYSFQSCTNCSGHRRNPGLFGFIGPFIWKQIIPRSNIFPTFFQRFNILLPFEHFSRIRTFLEYSSSVRPFISKQIARTFEHSSNIIRAFEHSSSVRTFFEHSNILRAFEHSSSICMHSLTIE